MRECARRSPPVLALFVLLAAALAAQTEDLAQKSRAAKELMASGRFADAIPIYDELCRALPANMGLRLNLALALHMAGREKEAVPEFERVLQGDPANQPALLSLGVALLQLNQPARAVAPLQKIVALQPENVEARGMLANALLSLGRAREATSHFRELTRMAAGDPKAWYGLGRSYEALAQRSFKELDKTSQGSAEWLSLIAETRMERRQFRAAFYFYTEALRKNPSLPGLHASLAEVYRRSGHNDWAAVEDKKERALGPPDCGREKAACDFAAGRFLEAASGTSPYWRARAANELAFRAYSRLGTLPESIELHSVKADILTSHGDYLEAANEWRAAGKLAPRDRGIARQAAVALYLAHDYEHALPELRPMLAGEPASAELHFFVGDSLLRLEKPDEGLPELQTAVKLDPKLLPARASLGLALIRLDKPAEAIPHLSAALEIDEDGSLHYQLARAYQRSGNADLAKETMRKYQELRRQVEAQKQDVEEKAQIRAPDAPQP
jgi:tetratricopeptide (TPR) repeat protein